MITFPFQVKQLYMRSAKGILSQASPVKASTNNKRIQEQNSIMIIILNIQDWRNSQRKC